MRSWIAWIGIAALVVGLAAATTKAPRGIEIVRQIDHVLMVVPSKASMTAFLADTLGLPLVWGGPGSSWTASTGISAGNVNLELFGDDSLRRGGFISAVAFQAVDFAALHEQLERNGIAHHEPESWPPDTTGRRWTTLGLRGFGMGAFFVQYHHFDMNERRSRFQKLLSERAGGALGIARVLEIRRAVPDLEEVTENWNRLVSPSASSYWTFGEGPSVRLLRPLESEASAVVIEVASLRLAGEALDSLRVGYSQTGDTLRLDSSRFAGVGVLLVGTRPPM